MVMDKQALRLLGSVALARASRGEDDTSAISVLKLLGSEAELRASEHALAAAGSDGLIHPALTGPYAPMNLDHYFASWFERYARRFSGTIAGGHLGDSAQHHRPAGTGATPRLIPRAARPPFPGEQTRNRIIARYLMRFCVCSPEGRQSMTAACLRSVTGRASSCSSQMRCSFARVSSRPAPTLRPGVNVAGSLRMPWMTPMVS